MRMKIWDPLDNDKWFPRNLEIKLLNCMQIHICACINYINNEIYCFQNNEYVFNSEIDAWTTISICALSLGGYRS